MSAADRSALELADEQRRRRLSAAAPAGDSGHFWSVQDRHVARSTPLPKAAPGLTWTATRCLTSLLEGQPGAWSHRANLGG
jgi:hypothetical protein